MLSIIFKGILLGFSLTFLIGPLFFSIIQTGIERGFRAGLAFAAGVWASDAFFVAAVLFGVRQIKWLTEQPSFVRWSGVGGGLLLLSFGAGCFFGKNRFEMAASPLSSASFLSLFGKGFLINTINPFTVFFWLGITTAVLVPNGWSFSQSLVFFGAMLTTLALTDAAKAFLAKKIGGWLTEKHIGWVRRGIGFLLVAFGLAMIYRVF